MSFKHRSMPIVIAFPKDNDGVARTCEVRATLASQGDQAGVKSALQTSLKSKPFEQSDSAIWMFDTKTGRAVFSCFQTKRLSSPISALSARHSRKSDEHTR
jgi:hypothetical protein